MEKRHARLVVLLAGAFFLSGFSALLYQVVWQRLLGLFTGSDVRSVTMITGAYLAGLGVGSLIGSAFADRLSSRSAVRLFALCNLLIAAFAAVSRFFYYDLLFLQGGALAEQPIIMLVVVFISLLIPTTLMGLSLPLVAKAVVRAIEHAAKSISRVYAINTLGAGIGSFVTGWVLIGTLGYDGALYIGAALSTAVGLIAFGAARRFAHDDAAPALPGSVALVDAFRLPRSVWGWCGLVFASGFIVISLEIVWFRLLDFTLKSSVYSYGHLLAFFLIADALGSLYGTRIVGRIRHPRRVFLLLQAAIALYALLITWFLAVTASRDGVLGQYIAANVGYLSLELLTTTPAYAYGIIVVYGLLPFIVLFPPAFMVGMYFPIVQKAIQNDPHVVGQRTGMVEVANIAGNTLGSILTGTLILNLVGSPGALRLVGLIGFGFMLVLMLEKRGRALAGGLAASLLVVVIGFPDLHTFWNMMHGRSVGTFTAAEDSTGISAILTRPGDDARIWANGRDQGTLPPYEWHTFIGALPALLHPDPQSAMVIGIGSSGTPYGIGVRDTLSRITAVELIGSELDALRAFSAVDGRGAFVNTLFSDPRYELIIGDGRRELALSGQQFDIVVVDAVLPWTSHAGLLYSQEFYALVRRHLAPGGIVVQWRPSLRSEITFTAAFPHTLQVGGVVMIGSDQAIPFDGAALMEAFSTPNVSAYLQAGGTNVGDYRFWLTQSEVMVYAPGSPRPQGQVTTDLFPRDEYYLNQPLGDIRLPVAGVGWVPMQ
ncbi:MAG: fused MFS/spermidine synthase [bacterium]|nr:fused MFS/spermidine synthase [bacterium]